jgi:hypothetical protein
LSSSQCRAHGLIAQPNGAGGADARDNHLSRQGKSGPGVVHHPRKSPCMGPGRAFGLGPGLRAGGHAEAALRNRKRGVCLTLWRAVGGAISGRPCPMRKAYRSPCRFAQQECSGGSGSLRAPRDFECLLRRHFADTGTSARKH